MVAVRARLIILSLIVQVPGQCKNSTASVPMMPTRLYVACLRAVATDRFGLNDDNQMYVHGATTNKYIP